MTSALDAIVIGAGVAGLACARRLSDGGMAVGVFDRAPRAGGRLGSLDLAGVPVDAGAPYFTARDPGFVGLVTGLERSGVVAEWRPRLGRLTAGGFDADDLGHRRFVGTPTMRSLANGVAGDLEVRLAAEVLGLVPLSEGGWNLAIPGVPSAVHLVLAMPPADIQRLLDRPVGWTDRLEAVPLAPCLVLAARWDSPLGLAFDAAWVDDPLIAWVANEASKPGRPVGERWVIHATPEASATGWAQARDPAPLLETFRRLTGAPQPSDIALELWHHALPTAPLDAPYLWDSASRVGACGDWCAGPRVEGAWLSGTRLASAILGAG